MRPSYQLTAHPVGSKNEFWAMTWPLMIGLLSSTAMLFIDRLFLANWDPLALNAAVIAGMAYYMFLIIPMGIVEIAEVLVGRLHGEKRLTEIGSATWQMVWIAIGFLPIFLLIAVFAPALIFHGSENIQFETSYFRTLLMFAPIQCAVIAVCGFFIGIGNVKIVTFSAILSNIVNIGLDYWFIFGGGPVPALGVVGAAVATGIALAVQLLILLAIYWTRHNRRMYGTNSLAWNRPFLLKACASDCLQALAAVSK